MVTKVDRGTTPPYSLIQQYEFTPEKHPIADDYFTDWPLNKHLGDKGLIVSPREDRSSDRLENRVNKLEKKQMDDYRQWVAQIIAGKSEDTDQLRQGEYRKNPRLWDNKYSVAATQLRKAPATERAITQRRRSNTVDMSTVHILSKRITHLQSTIKKSTKDMENVKQTQTKQDESVVSLQQEVQQIKVSVNEQQSPILDRKPPVEVQTPVDLLKIDWKKYYLFK